MTWTDGNGVTHEIATYTDIEGTIRPWISWLGVPRDPYEDLGYAAWMLCRVQSPTGSKASTREVDCMACLVKGAT